MKDVLGQSQAYTKCKKVLAIIIVIYLNNI